jgi:hypothetical protein
MFSDRKLVSIEQNKNKSYPNKNYEEVDMNDALKYFGQSRKRTIYNN